MEILPRSFYRRDTKNVAQELLGKMLVYFSPHGKLAGEIVETEAYYGSYDPASHAYRKTPRSSIMFGSAGVAYIYLNYGIHYLLNVVTEKVSIPGAVLIRAIEPLEGIEVMKRNRKVSQIEELCNGPGKLTKSMSIDIALNGHNLTKKPLIVAGNKRRNIKIKAVPRIGISVAKDELLRYYVEGNRFVSRK